MAKKNFQIPVFAAERKDGIDKLVQANASISYVTQLEDVKLSQQVAQEFLHSVASNEDKDQFDLFYLTTVLVTTCCNKNFDVFAKEPTWAARYSPIHKQFNLEHDQSKIIGHMTSAQAVNEQFEIIPDDTPIDEIPDKFHILTGAVIYRALSDEKAQEAIEQIISEIANNEWYVSMECLFRGFDYAAISATGEQKVIPRTEETAFLTKHLRQYGGSGSFNGFTLGRVLKDITFSGKGLVRRPANPESIIFNENITAFNGSFASLGYITSSEDSNFTSLNKDSERVSMANENTDVQVKNLETQLTEARNEIKALTEQVKTHESSATTAKITNLETQVKALEADLKTAIDAKAELDTKLKDAETRASDFEKSAVAAEKEVAEAKAAEKTRARTDSLRKLNAPEDEANKIVAMLSEKSDEEFNALAGLFADKWKAAPAAASTTPAPAAKVDQTVLETVEPEEDATLAAGGTNDEVETTRQKMSTVFASMLGQKLPPLVKE